MKITVACYIETGGGGDSGGGSGEAPDPAA